MNEKQEQVKSKIVEAFKAYPEISDPSEYSLKEIMNGMIQGIALRPGYESLLPLLQEVMDVLREEDPTVNDSAEKTVETWRVIMAHAAPPVIYRADEDPKRSRLQSVLCAMLRSGQNKTVEREGDHDE